MSDERDHHVEREGAHKAFVDFLSLFRGQVSPDAFIHWVVSVQLGVNGNPKAPVGIPA
ncbi:MAG: hypothetical protein ACKO1N_09775 [Erythrobacter sp.]